MICPRLIAYVVRFPWPSRVGASSAQGVALGMSVAKNLIGFSNTSPAYTYLSTANPGTLVAGNKVKVASGPLTGREFSSTSEQP